jgi:D-sedoheptulose 7-phosphate isomerase
MKKIVFTNGCFDLIHPGHIELLKKAKELGTNLIVGINSDESVKNIKGVERPVLNQSERKMILESIQYVDEVQIFDELTPEKLIKKIKPDVLVKGGDWQEAEIIGADFVRNQGGEVFSIPLVDGYSTTNMIEKFSDEKQIKNSPEPMNSSDEIIQNYLENHKKVMSELAQTNIKNIQICAEMIIHAFRSGKKVLICGNGGSAADAQHIAAEFVGRYETERKALPAIALTTDTSALTAITNDYDFEKVFSRQVEALGVEGDVLIAISTSGNSKNVIEAVISARKKNCKVIGLTGKNGKKLAGLCDACILVPADKTAHIQENHITIGHIWCELVDKSFDNGKWKMENG